jgi:hypothetical protein
MAIMAAWTVRRCDASTLRWMVVLIFEAAGLVVVLTA